MTKRTEEKAGIPGYLTTQEVADRLRVTRKTVYNWLKNEVLEATKVGPKIWLVSEQQLAEFLKHSAPKPRRMVDMLSADPSKWGKGRQPAAAPPPAPASAVQPVPAPAVQPVPPQNPVQRPPLPQVGDLEDGLHAAFGPWDFETVGDAHAAYGAFEPGASSSSIPPAKISQKKRGGRRR